MFDELSSRFEDAVKGLRGEAKISENNINDALKEVKRALLDADVSLSVVKEFITDVKDKAIGEEVVRGVNPGQKFIEVVNKELINIMGNENSPLNENENSPTVILMAGLQGAGKTTATGKLGLYLKEKEKKVLLVAADIYRPAAVEQLKTLGSQYDLEVFSAIEKNSKPEEIAKEALNFASENDFNSIIIDTAGIRRKKNVKYGTEFFGINRAFKSIDRSDVCVLVIDAFDGVTDQDQKLAGRIEEQGRACIIVVNKWDLVEKNSSTIYQVEKELRSKLYFLHWSKMIFISALTGQRVDNIFEHALNAENQHRRRVTTSVVNEVLKESISWKSPPTKRSGKQGRLYYGTQVKNKPPTFTLFVNDPKLFGITYRRYIEKQIRVNLGFEGTPLILLWRGKQQRALNKEVERENIELIQKDYRIYLPNFL